MPWFEDDTFWQALFPCMFPERRMAAAPEEVAQAVALAGVSSGAVLDLCCGPGRHAAALAVLGFQVTAVDRSPFLLAEARRRTAPGAPAVEWVQADMREFCRPAAFDLAINLFTSFGYFDTREEDLAVLFHLRRSLKTGGMLVMDLMGKEVLASRPALTTWEETSDGGVWISHCQVLDGFARSRVTWLLVHGEQARRYEFEHSLYSGVELAAALARAGFSDIRLFGSLAGTPYGPGATRLVATARA